jgi:hypothetical protein
MEFLTYLVHLPVYIGLPILFGVGFIVVMLALLLPFFIIYLIEDPSDYSPQAPIDGSSDGGAAACAAACVACI